MLAAEPGARAAAFLDGCAPVLARGIGRRVAAVVTSERTSWYLTILYALLLFRRDHEIEPMHEDVWARVATPAERMGSYDGPTFWHDVEQLVAWGAVERITEAHKLRSYRDNRRERFRYRLTEDAVALLEWLESRLAAKLAGRVGDSRDRLADVVGNVRELRRVLDAWRTGGAEAGTEDAGGRRLPSLVGERADLARRALYLIATIGDTIDEIGTELLTFLAEMAAFASRPYDVAALREILGWLERYVGVYVRRIEELRVDVETSLNNLGAPRYREALEESRLAVEEERAALPRAMRAAGVAAPGERIDAHAAFFAARGGLAAMCARIDESARAVVWKMQRHLRELERRSERLNDLRAAIRTVAMGPEHDECYANFVGSVIATAHVRVDRGPAAASRRAPPPLPRAHARTQGAAAARPIARKRDGLEAVRELTARRRQRLGQWLDELLVAADRIRLSANPPAGPGAARRWIEVARALHLGGGRVLADVGIAIDASEGEVVIADDRSGLVAPDCWVVRRKT
ncbi:MAG TPA: DUF2397 family protein [Kofleriaceae bacterium]|jgi:hypothetical protein